MILLSSRWPRPLVNIDLMHQLWQLGHDSTQFISAWAAAQRRTLWGSITLSVWEGYQQAESMQGWPRAKQHVMHHRWQSDCVAPSTSSSSQPQPGGAPTVKHGALPLLRRTHQSAAHTWPLDLATATSSNFHTGTTRYGDSESLADASGSAELLSPALEARVRQLSERSAELEALLAGSGASGTTLSPSALREAGREIARLLPLAEAYRQLQRVQQELESLGALLGDADPRVREMAQEEGEQLRHEAATLTRSLLMALLPRDPRDGRPALLELRAGAGGLEAALFCGDLLGMYHKYAQNRGWTWQILEHAAGDMGGVRYALVAVSDSSGTSTSSKSNNDQGTSPGAGDDSASEGVYGTLRSESGVHRVQRVPLTESQGRVHTSTAAVVVLPQVDEVDARLRTEDLRIDTMRASGAGGQHVNTTDSAVRITHLPTGLVVTCQNERSQHQNKATALKVLRSRLYDMEAQKRAKEASEARTALVASTERSERIRTYNFAQGRVTDHRIHLTVHDLPAVLEGGEPLERLIAALRAARQDEELKRLTEQEASKQ